MLTLHTVDLLINVITFLVSYCILITIVNVFHAWVNLKLGDDTGAELGFLTLNPLEHVDPVGLFFLFTFYFGWSKRVPIEPSNFRYPYRTLKLAISYFADPFMHFVLSVVGIVILLTMFDSGILGLMNCMIGYGHISHLAIVKYYPQLSSLAVVIGFICFSFVYMNSALIVINFVINLISFLFVVLSDYFAGAARYANYVIFGFPLVLVLFFTQYLRLVSIYLIWYIEWAIVYISNIAMGGGL